MVRVLAANAENAAESDTDADADADADATCAKFVGIRVKVAPEESCNSWW